MGETIQLGGFLKSEEKVREASEKLKAQFPDILSQFGCYSERDDRTLTFFDDYVSGVEDAVAAISSELDCPAFWFHMYDADFWMYQFYSSGTLIDRFNTRPGCLTEISTKERQLWRGSASKIAAHWDGVDAESIEKYLVDHETDGFDDGAKAYPNDEFEAWDCWQLVDFTAKLGIPYPPDE